MIRRREKVWRGNRPTRAGVSTLVRALAVGVALTGVAILMVGMTVGPISGWPLISDASAQDSPISESRLAQLSRTEPAEAEEDIVVTESVKEFIDKGKPIGHVIIGLLIISLFLVVDQLRVHLLEKVRANKILRADLGKVSVSEFEAMAATGDRSRIGRLLIDAISTFKQSGDLSLVNAEAKFFREKEEHRFNTFESRMAFLADTAGGLGLLGTVWGIYRGFAAKAVVQSNDELLSAMGIALVTTFMGIVASVIINWMSTETGAAVRGRIMNAMTKIEDYREILLRELSQRAV